MLVNDSDMAHVEWSGEARRMRKGGVPREGRCGAPRPPGEGTRQEAAARMRAARHAQEICRVQRCVQQERER